MPGVQAFNAPTSKYFKLDPDDVAIIDDPGHLLYDERIKQPLSEELVASIDTWGVVTPILVRKDGDEAQVVDGRQRVRAAREVNKRRRAARRKEMVYVPALLDRTEDENAPLKVEIANSGRLEDSPLTKARKAQRLLDMGHDESVVARSMGITVAYLKQLQALLSLDPKVKRAVDAGSIAASSAAKLSKLTRDDQVAQLDELLAGGGKVTAAKARAAVATKTGNGNGHVAPGKRELKALAAELLSHPELKQFRLGIEYALGMCAVGQVDGLVEVLAKLKEV